jgi:hypothetical protein
MAVDLEALDARLNTVTLTLLGDTITYRPGGGAALPSLKAIVDYGDDTERLSGSKVISGECAVEVPVSIIAEPVSADVIELPRRAGQQFHPKDWTLDESGQNWLILLKRKPS